MKKFEIILGREDYITITGDTVVMKAGTIEIIDEEGQVLAQFIHYTGWFEVKE